MIIESIFLFGFLGDLLGSHNYEYIRTEYSVPQNNLARAYCTR